MGVAISVLLGSSTSWEQPWSSSSILLLGHRIGHALAGLRENSTNMGISKCANGQKDKFWELQSSSRYLEGLDKRRHIEFAPSGTTRAMN
jgi:hypothetical protein